MPLQVDWRTNKRRIISGRDHLGVASFSVSVYGQLLPGVTNVTDRTRYFSFYPWVIHTYATQANSDDRVKWLTWYRRLDYAYALASVAASIRDEVDARAVVGADRARKDLHDAASNDILNLEPAELDDQGRVPKGSYFKNPNGGYGQYYKAVLAGLGLFVESKDYKFPDMRLTTYAGLPVARSIAAQPGFQRLREVAIAGKATFEEFADIGAEVSPSAITPDSEEHSLLCKLFWGEDEELCRAQPTHSRLWRRNTFVALLKFIDQNGPPLKRTVEMYRTDCAQSRLAWVSDEAGVSQCIRGWADYQWNEYFNFALETLLWAAVQLLDEQPQSASRLAATMAAMALEDSGLNASNVGSFVKQTAQLQVPGGVGEGRLPADVMQEVLESHIKAGDVISAVRDAVLLLGHLASVPDDREEGFFEVFSDFSELFRSHRIHLLAWRYRVKNAGDQPVSRFLGQTFIDWVINQHLHVAIRKLAGQKKQTFKFAPEDGVLKSTTEDTLEPGPTNPRLRQGLQMLIDLDYVTEDEEGCLALTPRGTQKLGDVVD